MTRLLSEQDNLTYLTVALIMLLFVTALADQFEIQMGQLLVQSSIVMVLAVGVWSIRSRRSWHRTQIGFIISIALVSVAGLFLELAGLEILWL
jgi:hypothetical protein